MGPEIRPDGGELKMPSPSMKEERGRWAALIREATEADLAAVLELENRLREDRPEARSQGFLLSGGDSPESYRAYLRPGCFFVVEDVVSGQTRIVASLFVLHPESDRMNGLRGSAAKFKFVEGAPDVFATRELSWLAKIAVDPDFMGRGIATSLYERLFETHPTWSFVTTTVREPIFNLPSFELHRRFGFEQVGTLFLGDRGALKNILCDVHFRRGVER